MNKLKQFANHAFSEKVGITRFEKILIHALVLYAIAPKGFFS